MRRGTLQILTLLGILVLLGGLLAWKSQGAFLSAGSVALTATDASRYGIMAVGMAIVIVSGGIDLSVGSIYALAAVLSGLALRSLDAPAPATVFALAAGVSLGTGLVCGLANGLLVVGLKVHPFLVTLATLWIFRGTAYALTEGSTITVPGVLMDAAKASVTIGGERLRPVPLLAFAAAAAAGSVFLNRMIAGRRVFAVGGNPEAARYAGLPVARTLVLVYAVSGLAAGLSSLVAFSYSGAAAAQDGTGYELYVIAAAVIGGASLQGGRGSAAGAALGALLIALLRSTSSYLKKGDTRYEWIVIGCALIIAILLDRLTLRLARRAGQEP